MENGRFKLLGTLWGA